MDTNVKRGEIYYADLSPVVAQCCGLPKDSVILLEQIRTLDKRRLRERMGRVDGAVMERVDDAIAVSFGLPRSRLV